MRFRKPGSGSKEYPFAGTAVVMDGHGAVLDAARASGDVVVISAGVGAGVRAGATPGGDAPDVRVAPPREAPGLVAGMALAGVRVSALVEHPAVDAESLAAAAGKRLACVTHLLCRSRTRQAASSSGSHDAYHALADSGAFLMFARNVQEVADFALIARYVAEQSLTPGVCAQDLYQTSHSVQGLRRVSRELAHDYLGGSDDIIPCPNDAQAVLFGAERRRLPVMLDMDRPAGIGGVQDQESHFRALAAQRPFFAAHLPAIMDEAMRAYGERTGRFHERVSGYRSEDAEMLVVGQGAVMDELVAVVDHLRSAKKLKVGLVSVSVLRPFAGGALSHILAGKRAVAVLERTDSPLGDSCPLFQEVTVAIERATENARAGDASPYPDHATLRRIEDRPRLFSGVYGIGGEMPSFGDLAAVFEHMAEKGNARRFYVGARFDTETRRFPHLEALQQRLERHHPALDTISLKASSARPARDIAGGAFQLRSLSMQGGMFAGNLFAQVLADAMGWDVRTFPDGGLDPNLQPVSLTTAHAAPSGAVRARPVEVGAVMVSGEHMIEALPLECPLEARGVLIVASVQDPESLWRGLSRRTANWVRAGELRVHVVDARKIASETAAHPSFIDALAIWSLMGACARCVLSLDADATARVAAALRSRLEGTAGLDAPTVSTIASAFARGGEEVRGVEWTAWQDAEHAPGEPDAPWTVRDGARHDGSVFDPVRFWNSVGYLYDRGQSAFTLADPYLATGVMPARSSAFRDLSRYRLRVPEWIPSACTGCAGCWTLCPESAMPVTIRALPELVEAAARECERSGDALVQIKRMADALAKQAYTLARQQAPQPYETLGAILGDAFARVVDKAGLAGEKRDALAQEFGRLRAAVDRLPVAVTERFFTKPHETAAGNGRLLSIAINPLSCTACGVCIAACPEEAIAWAEQAPERLEHHRHDWDFLTHLPALPAPVLSEFVRDDDPDSSVLRLLDTAVYHSLVGGDGSFPGNGAKTAVHLVTAAIESEMRARYATHVERLSRLIGRIEQRIQGQVDATAKINDFEEFGQRLSRVAGREMTPDVLRSLAGGAHTAPAVDASRLARLTAQLHALKEQKRSYTEGDGRARMLLTIDPAPGAFWNGTYPYNPHPQPWVSHVAGDAAALALGVFDGVVRRLGGEFAVCRQAEAELEDHGGPESALTALAWADFSAEERRLVPVVLVLADAAAADEAALSAVLRGDAPVRIVLIDHDVVAVDGAATPVRRVGLPALRVTGAASAFLLQSSVGKPGHLMHGVAESMKRDGPALYRIYAPDAVGDGVPADGIVDLARLAVESRAVPLFIVRPGEERGLSLDGNPEAQSDWTTRELSVKEPSGAAGKVRTTVTLADWASRQARFRRHFTPVSRGQRSAQMKPLAGYLALPPDARDGLQPYIDVCDREGRHALMVVSADMVRAAENAAAAWRELRDVARGIQPPVTTAADAGAQSRPAALPTEGEAVQKLAENLLRLGGFGSDETFFNRRLREFVSHSKGANGAPDGGTDGAAE